VGILVQYNGHMRQDNDLKCLDKLIADLGLATGGQGNNGADDLLSEHLHAARRNLLGSMPGEYRLSLDEAKASVACISNNGARKETKEILQRLIEAGAAKPRA
jgi:hypothetical protein